MFPMSASIEHPTIDSDGFHATMTFQGTLDKSLFKAYVSDFLVQSGGIVVMDHSSVHVLDPIYEHGRTVLFLPPYSSDFNPIECSKMKAMLKRRKARTDKDLEKALLTSIEYITVEDINNRFKHGWYGGNG